MSQQQDIDLSIETQKNQERFGFEPIKGYPMLNWRGKRPFTSTQYYPAQLKEQHGESINGWLNKIFWGDNLQVIAHLLKQFRGKVDLIYIDPPFDSMADYKKKIILKGENIENDINAFEEKQYTDMWTNDEYLQFMYERFVLIRELMSPTASLYVHCDYRRSHYLKITLDDIFGASNFQNEIVWKRTTARSGSGAYNHIHDTILFYSKTNDFIWNQQHTPYSKDYLESNFKYDESGALFRESPITAPGLRSGESGSTWKGLNPGAIGKGRHWAIPSFLQHLLTDDAKKSPLKALDELEANGRIKWARDGEGRPNAIQFESDLIGVEIQSIWSDFSAISSSSKESESYPTQKPEALLERIILTSSNNDSVIFDCFMGSGTTQAVAMKLGRRFIGADINLGAIQTTTKRLIKIAEEINSQIEGEKQQSFNDNDESNQVAVKFTGFEVYNVNHYDVFRNPIQAKELLIEALGIQKFTNSIYDGEKDGRMVKIMPINRIATSADLSDLIAGVDYKAFDKRRDENANRPVEKILLVCMGHEPDLRANLQQEIDYKLDIEIVDILRDKTNLQFKRESEARLKVSDGKLSIERFYPMNLLQKISLTKETVDDWREMVESVMIDWNYDGAVFTPTTTDVPSKTELVEGSYDIPADSGTIRVKITDLLSESWEGEING